MYYTMFAEHYYLIYIFHISIIMNFDISTMFVHPQLIVVFNLIILLNIIIMPTLSKYLRIPVIHHVFSRNLADETSQ